MPEFISLLSFKKRINPLGIALHFLVLKISSLLEYFPSLKGHFLSPGKEGANISRTCR